MVMRVIAGTGGAIDADPMGRMCLPEDVAASVLFLASDESRAISGIELRIDSGQFVMSI